MKKNIEWAEHWDEMAKFDGLKSMGRSSSSLKDYIVYYSSIVKLLNGVNETDTILDIGGGLGYISMTLSPSVEKIYLVDSSIEMVKKASKELKNDNKIIVMLDALPNLDNIHSLEIKFNKIIIGSVLQYLDGYDAIQKTFESLYELLCDSGSIALTHNPDITKKSQFINSFTTLDWPQKQKEDAIVFEDKQRFWMDYDKIQIIAKKNGFSDCRKYQIPIDLFQASHMFDMSLKKSNLE